MLELMGLLLLFMIIAAIVAIETRDLLAAVISVTAVNGIIPNTRSQSSDGRYTGTGSLMSGYTTVTTPK